VAIATVHCIAIKMKTSSILLAILYLSISAACFFLATRSLQSRQLISKRGIKGTSLERSDTLRWVQIVNISGLGLGLFAYGLIYGATALKR
jgi:hypothetical protein